MRIRPSLALAFVAGLVACSDDTENGPSGEAGGAPATSTTGTTTVAGSGGSPGSGGGGSGAAVSGATGGGAGGSGPGVGGSGAGGAGGTAACDEAYTAAMPPAPPAGASEGSPLPSPLGLRNLLFGNTTREGLPTPDAWEDYGFDLDDRNTGADTGCQCQPASGAPPSVLRDAPGGVDNSFGRNVLPLFSAFEVDLSGTVTQAIADGTFNLGFDLLGAQETDAMPSPATVVQLRNGSTGTWETSFESLDGSGDPVTRAEGGWVTSDTWVSSPIDRLVLPLPVGGTTLALTLHDVVVVMELDGDRAGATNGTIAGHLVTEELVTAFADWAGSIDASLCPPSPTFESIAQQLRQASDVVAGAPQDPSVTCDAISIALGFEAEVVDVDGVAGPVDPPPSPCDP